MRILIVEDDMALSATLSRILEEKGYETMVCTTFEQAYNEISRGYDCYLLDQLLPDGNGLDLCRMIREKSSSPILIVSSDTAESSILKGYALEADDYIEKPFRLNVLLAKLESVLRRSGLKQSEYTIRNAGLSTELKQLTIADRQIALSKTECTILETLFQNYPHVVSRKQILADIYAHTNKDTSLQTLNVRLSELRKKMGDQAYHIEAIPQSGLRWKT